jgi:hypothetical protein
MTVPPEPESDLDTGMEGGSDIEIIEIDSDADE